MEVGEAITQRLGAGSATNALVGTHVHWVFRPQAEALPGVVMTGVFEERPQHMDAFEDMRTARIQGSAFASTYAQARGIAEAMITDLVPAVQVSDVLFWNADVEGPRDLGEQTEEGFVHQAVVDFIIRYAKAA